MTLLVLGFLIGLRHALEADHLAAIATIATRTQKPAQAIRYGAFWGLGHTSTLFLLCLIAFSLSDKISQQVSYWGEVFVALLLIGLGFDVLRRLWRDKVHFHIHQHDSASPHFHAHSHTNDVSHAQSQHIHQHDQGLDLRSYIIGLIHGIAGSGVLIILASESAITFWHRMSYVVLFGIGSIIGMTVLSMVIAIPFRTHNGPLLTRINTLLQVVVGVITISLGATSLYTSFI